MRVKVRLETFCHCRGHVLYSIPMIKGEFCHTMRTKLHLGGNCSLLSIKQTKIHSTVIRQKQLYILLAECMRESLGLTEPRPHWPHKLNSPAILNKKWHFSFPSLGPPRQHVLPVHPVKEPGPAAERHLYGGGRSVRRPHAAQDAAPPAQRSEDGVRGDPAPHAPPHLPPHLRQPLELRLFPGQPGQDHTAAQQPQPGQLRQVCRAPVDEGPQTEEAERGVAVRPRHRRRGAESAADQSEAGGHLHMSHIYVPQTSAGLQQQRWDQVLQIYSCVNVSVASSWINCWEIEGERHRLPGILLPGLNSRKSRFLEKLVGTCQQ